jgi:hypothetical protein
MFLCRYTADDLEITQETLTEELSKAIAAIVRPWSTSHAIVSKQAIAACPDRGSRKTRQ